MGIQKCEGTSADNHYFYVNKIAVTNGHLLLGRVLFFFTHEIYILIISIKKNI